MPELAEAFTLTAQLAELLGVPFETDSRLALPKDRHVPSLGNGPYTLVIHDFASVCGDQSIEEELVDATPTRVQHQGKKGWILWKTKGGVVETEVRFGMTGSFAVAKTQHTRLEFKGPAGSFYFNDIRKFGGIVTTGNPVAPSATARINIEQVYHDAVDYRDSTLKELLTDQTVLVSGIGNYVVNEACHMARLHPDTHAGLVAQDEFEKLIKCVTAVVVLSAQLGGCTLRDFKDILGRPGSFQDRLLIYGKSECPSCHKPIEPLRRAGETTSWVCPKCQELRRLHPIRQR
jgi:formamidopyrimidine-DNA glycosylase